MLDDEKPMTETQRRQFEVGRSLAYESAVQALIETHPDPVAFASALDRWSRVAEQMLLTGLALQHDDGMRQGYSEGMRGIRAAMR